MRMYDEHSYILSHLELEKIVKKCLEHNTTWIATSMTSILKTLQFTLVIFAAVSGSMQSCLKSIKIVLEIWIWTKTKQKRIRVQIVSPAMNKVRNKFSNLSIFLLVIYILPDLGEGAVAVIQLVAQTAGGFMSFKKQHLLCQMRKRLSLAETATWADSGQLQFWSEPSEILNLRSPNTQETIAFNIPWYQTFDSP